MNEGKSEKIYDWLTYNKNVKYEWKVLTFGNKKVYNVYNNRDT